ncbi:septation protein SepH [Janibacter hoylei]|uniref:septation protein SepH n=1 Tax=Janibacter hoylei TaxID=364298 RepID=UPI0021A31179|nr:septation protein SepH [Janibacter hoylei]MCT1619734.1 septation protein SepH [Janibacter hoylei]MCT2294118.1 septation protein SepH [Janibacter hoylei]
MRDLRLIGVHDDGEHLLVTDDSGEEYRLRIDEPLRAAARRDRPRLGQLQIAIDNNVRPREVQAMIRAGASADEVAARTGWDLDKIARFEGPVLAEREHVATRAQAVRMRGTNQAGSPETLAQRAATRLTGRGVEPSSVVWDACRDGEGQWTVSAVFTAGGRERTATWWFDLAGMSVVAKNDEAKWLSEADTPAGPVPTTVHRPTAVFDVEVEETKVERAQRANTDDLINSMREHSGAKSRRRGGRRKTRAAAETAPAEDALPIDELPPAAGGTHPRDEESPERAAAAAREESTADTTAEQAAAADEAKGGTRPAEDDAPAPTADADTGADEAPEGESTVDEPVDEETASEPDVSDEDDADQADAVQDGGDQSSEADSGSKSRGRKGRARVPSWDDVMFGTTRD